MTVILLRDPMDEADVLRLIAEFPFLQFEVWNSVEPQPLPESLWSEVEILYSRWLHSEELAMASHLKWIHVPSAYLDGIAIAEVNKRNILISQSFDEVADEVALFVLAAVLSFAKNLYALRWMTLQGVPASTQEAMDDIWSLPGKTFLQIGVGYLGSCIAKKARHLDMRVVGVTQRYSFHPHCHKVISFQQLKSILPSADIVCVTTGREGGQPFVMGRTELELMKEGSILVLIGTVGNIDQRALIEVAANGKFRGIVLDLYCPNGPEELLPELSGLPNLILTPAVAAYPSIGERNSLRLFRYNLRQFAVENYREMKSLLNRTVLTQLAHTD